MINLNMPLVRPITRSEVMMLNPLNMDGMEHLTPDEIEDVVDRISLVVPISITEMDQESEKGWLARLIAVKTLLYPVTLPVDYNIVGVLDNTILVRGEWSYDDVVGSTPVPRSINDANPFRLNMFVLPRQNLDVLHDMIGYESFNTSRSKFPSECVEELTFFLQSKTEAEEAFERTRKFSDAILSVSFIDTRRT